MCLFFFSSRRRHTRSLRDWSSDVCSSDLNARLATLREDLPELGAIEHGLIAARDGRIVFAGSHSDFPSDADAAERIDCAGRWITPGLVDCHTHLVFGGNRAHEF